MQDKDKEGLREWSISVQEQQEIENYALRDIIDPSGLSLKASKKGSFIPSFEGMVMAEAKDRSYFLKNFSELLQKYSGKYVAIRGQTVLDTDNDLAKLLIRIQAERDKGKRYYIGKVDEEFKNREYKGKNITFY